MGKSEGPSGGCGLPPQYWGRGEHQRPGQTEKVTVRSLHFISYSGKFSRGRKFLADKLSTVSSSRRSSKSTVN